LSAERNVKEAGVKLGDSHGYSLLLVVNTALLFELDESKRLVEKGIAVVALVCDAAKGKTV
jgi:hypothetical protein